MSYQNKAIGLSVVISIVALLAVAIIFPRQLDKLGNMDVSSLPKESLITQDVPVLSFSSGKSQRETKLVNFMRFLDLLTTNSVVLNANLDHIRNQWHISYVPMLLEVGRFMPPAPRAQVFDVLETKTGNRFGHDFDKWMQWNWKQKYDQHPQYADFKLNLYRRIDPRFAEYFQKTDNAMIRLDEIRWGGVVRDGIPPLKNPNMLAADNANYLSDSDVVFGIELNGDARAYPKRILAWHEMFKDTIGGESVCGVY